MRIVNANNNKQEATRIRDQASGLERFDCYEPERPDNEKIHAISFDRIEDAAIFLISKPGRGIRMNPGSAIISGTLSIEF